MTYALPQAAAPISRSQLFAGPRSKARSFFSGDGDTTKACLHEKTHRRLENLARREAKRRPAGSKRLARHMMAKFGRNRYIGIRLK